MLASRIVSIEAQFRFLAPRGNKFQKARNVEAGDYYYDYDSSDEEEEVVAAIEFTWKHIEMCPWAKADSSNANKVDFDITKADKIFDMLLEKGHIKLITCHKIPSAEELKRRRYCKYHGSSTHYANDCKIFCDHIQKAIERGMIGLEKNKKKCILIKILSLKTWLLQCCQEERSEYLH
jgi:hypothetical protein